MRCNINVINLVETRFGRNCLVVSTAGLFVGCCLHVAAPLSFIIEPPRRQADHGSGHLTRKHTSIPAG
jgi:hypothetical protein